jgi:hypothetical protein
VITEGAYAIATSQSFRAPWPAGKSAPKRSISCSKTSLLYLLNEGFFSGGLTGAGFRSDRKSPR